MAYDPKCYDLAWLFLDGADVDKQLDMHAAHLAQRIQDTIEDFLKEKGL